MAPISDVQGLEFSAELKLRGNEPGGIAQAVELGFAVDPRPQGDSLLVQMLKFPIAF